ncbi:MAG: LysE family transporter, partial [Bacteroidota bacterium]
MAFLLGTGMAFAGILLPGMLNMTAVSISVKRGRRSGIQFVVGAAIVTAFQALIALFFADLLLRNPRIIHAMKQMALWLFIILAIAFFLKARRRQVARARKASGSKNFGAGFGLAFANALAIPYFLGVGSWLIAKGHVDDSLSSL